MTEGSFVGEARRFSLHLCNDLEFDETRKGRVGIIINELGNNMVRYAQGGTMIIRTFNQPNRRGIEILSVDSGPGLDESKVMRDGYTTGDTPGTGLGAVRRQADLFELFSVMGNGTVVLAQVFTKSPSVHSPSPNYEIGAISLPMKGEVLCGDAWCALETAPGIAILVADGLGHGPLAHKASALAVDTFHASVFRDVDETLKNIHKELRSSRGAAVFVAAVSEKEVKFVGAGNVRTVIQSPGSLRTLITQNGTAGIQIGTIRPLTQEWDGEGYLIIHTDGITARWSLETYPGIMFKHPSIVAAILNRDANRGTDDSTVVVIRRAP